MPLPDSLPRIFSPRRLVILQSSAFVALSTLLRLGLALGFPPDRPVSSGDWVQAFLVGLHFDVVVALALGAIPLGWALLVSGRFWHHRWNHWMVLVVTFLAWSVLAFLLIAEAYFFEEYRSRYNTVAIDYLIYPHEVFVNIWDTYNVPLAMAAVAVVALLVTVGSARWARTPATVPAKRPLGFAAAWLGAVVLLGAPLRLDEARFSAERTVNEIANNSIVSGLTAALTRNLDYRHFYPTTNREMAYTRARQWVGAAELNPSAPSDSWVRRIPGDPARPRLNVMLLLEESLGSEFFGCLGRPGPTLTPQLDRIAREEGLLFDNFYADGNRTIRGYEGVFCSFPPLPGDSIVVRDRSENVETIARVLQRDGYDTTFVYAGRGRFDGTRAFATANGWRHFVELKDFKNPEFTTVWGVANEDLYRRAIAEARERHDRGLPFLVTTMSVSNHRPYTYPPGHVAADPNERRRENVVTYSDYALGRFFELARKEPFWTNTIFVVVADHGARVYGSQTIPIRSYEIPLLIVGPAVVPEPKRFSGLGCQLDVAPTVLGLIGRPYDSAFFGRDVLHAPSGSQGRVLLNHNRSVGVYSDQHLVVFSLNRKIECFRGDPRSGRLERVDQPDDRFATLVADATAVFQVGDDLYMNRKFRIDGAPGSSLAAP